MSSSPLTSEDRGQLRVGGIECPTSDLVALLPSNVYSAILSRAALRQGVTLLPELERFNALAREIRGYEVHSGAGGTVANTLYEMGRLERADERRLELHFLGDASPDDTIASHGALDSLRRVGVLIHAEPSEGDARRAICFVDAESHDVAAIVLHPPDRTIRPQAGWPSLDVAIVTLQRLAMASDELLSWLDECPRVVLVLADFKAIDERTRSTVVRLGSSGRLAWVFGRSDELSALELTRSGSRTELAGTAELIGTRGKDSVLCWQANASQPIALPVVSVASVVTTLGAGDAYCGAFLRGRLRGAAVADAHAAACLSARAVLGVALSRIKPELSIHGWFGSVLTGREGTREDDGRMFGRVRDTCGITVISCGQTGVDQLALQSSSKLGLAGFAVMPAGRRTEAIDAGGRDSLSIGDSHVLELSSSSYRYTTYANAYLSDGTLLFDYRGSEGSEATRLACYAAGRPILELAQLTPREAVIAACAWARKHMVRVVNVAGNRGSLLDNRQIEHVRSVLSRVLMALSAQFSALRASFPQRRTRPTGCNVCFRLGVPNTPESRSLIQSFLRHGLGSTAELPYKRLVHAYPDLGLEVVYLRARDIPALVDRRFLDAGLCGSDLRIESNFCGNTLLDTGLQPCLLVRVARCDKPSTTIISQYPNVAARYLLEQGIDGRVEHSLGCAEAWLNAGWGDSVIDTWRTGSSADANDMHIMEVLAKTSLVLLSHGNPTELARQYGEWLAGELGSFLLNGGGE